MRILLDECCPRPIRRFLSEFQVFSVEQAGYKGLKNGDLLVQADEAFDLLITADKNLRYQQNLTRQRVAIIELPTNSWKRLEGCGPELARLVKRVQPGGYYVADFQNFRAG